MRRSYDVQLITDLGDSPYGVYLAADYCAEHEWGIEKLVRYLGIDSNNIGLDGRKSNRSSIPVVELHDKGVYKFGILANQFYYGDPDEFNTRTLKERVNLHNEKELGGAWCEYELAVAVHKKNCPHEYDFIRRLVEAIKVGDVAVYFYNPFGKNPFSRSGLCVCIASRVPSDVSRAMRDHDIDKRNLTEASAATGIHQLLHDKGKKYYACSPEWLLAEGKRNDTKHNVIYWLNPAEQGKNHYGWFTVEELEAWANGVVGNKIDMTEEEQKKHHLNR